MEKDPKKLRSRIGAIGIGVMAICAFGGIYLMANELIFTAGMDKQVAVYDTPFAAGFIGPQGTIRTDEATSEPRQSSETIAEVQTSGPAPATEVRAEYPGADYTIFLEKNSATMINANILSAEEAAEIGARYLWDMYGIYLDGNAIVMECFTDASQQIPYWGGMIYENNVVIYDRELQYHFQVEAVTGEFNRAEYVLSFQAREHGQTMKFILSEGEQYFNNNRDKFTALAEAAAERFLQGALTVEYKDIRALPVPESISSMAGERDYMPSSAYEELVYSAVNIIVQVTDQRGIQYLVGIDAVSHSVVSVEKVYQGVNYLPNTIPG